MKRIVIALGGNALQEAGKPATAESQLEVVEKTSEYIADIIESKDRKKAGPTVSACGLTLEKIYYPEERKRGQNLSVRFGKKDGTFSDSEENKDI